MKRTVIVHLHLTPEQARALHRTLVEHTQCFNDVAHVGFGTRCSNGIELHKQTYYPLRAEHPDLPAQLVCAARVKATEAVKSALDRLKKGRKTRAPHAQFCPIRYDVRSYWVKWETMTCSLATVTGRVQLGFTVPSYAQKYIGGKVCSADLCSRNGRYTLHIVVSLPDPAIPQSSGVVGVDLGLNRPAVTSTRHFLGERRWREQERRIFRIRRTLQAKGTKSAKRHLRKLSGKLLRQRKDHDHVISKRIVQYATPGNTIPRKPARSVGFNTAPIVVLNRSSSVENVATLSTPISMRPTTSERSTSRLLPTSVHLRRRVPVNVPIVLRLRAQMQAPRLQAGVVDKTFSPIIV